jgi:Tfp pilus assembly protein PilF
VRRAWASADNGDFEKAAFHMENALKHFPDDDHNWETLEYYYAASGQYKKAESCRRKQLES